jgi:hypothetical protein
VRRSKNLGAGFLNLMTTVDGSEALTLSTACCTSTPQRTFGPRSLSVFRV